MYMAVFRETKHHILMVKHPALAHFGVVMYGIRQAAYIEGEVEGKWCTTESRTRSRAITDSVKSAVALVTFDVTWPSLVSAPGAGLIGGKPRGLARPTAREDQLRAAVSLAPTGPSLFPDTQVREHSTSGSMQCLLPLFP